jgi:hypothetical protein
MRWTEGNRSGRHELRLQTFAGYAQRHASRVESACNSFEVSLGGNLSKNDQFYHEMNGTIYERNT